MGRRMVWALTLTCACFPAGWRGAEPLYLASNNSPFDVGPYLVKMGPERMAVVLEHSLESPPTVIWWVQEPGVEVTPDVRKRLRAQSRDGLWVAVLDELPKDLEVSYFVDAEVGTTEVHRFRSSRNRGEPFRFAALGDTRSGHRVHRALVEAIARENVDFVVNSGDLVETGGYRDQWNLFFDIEQPLISRAPLFVAVGNHDTSPRKLFRRWFLLADWAQDNRYFYHDWGDLRIICLDTELELRPGSAQYAFLDRVLGDAVRKDLLLVLSFHYPPYSSGAHGPNPGLQEIFDVVGPKYGVELILNGHDHNYERTKPIEGVTYIVAASGGAPIRRLQPSPWSAAVRTEPHFVLFDVEQGHLVGRAINLDGNVFDDFIIEPVAPRASF
jgi:acid phosphatase type 7